MSAHEQQTSYLTTSQLAARWGMSPATLRNWRFRGIGPRYFKPLGRHGKALYSLRAVEEWEAANTVGGEPGSSHSPSTSED